MACACWAFAVFVQLGILRQPGQAAAPLGRTLLALALSVAIAGLSYWLVEREFLACKALKASPEIEPARGRSHAAPATDNGVPVSL